MSRSLGDWRRLWFSVGERVGRRDYVLSGVALAVIKYTGDFGLSWAATGKPWLPTDYLHPTDALPASGISGVGPTYLLLFGLWSLPFIWIGMSMSIRRAIDAGRSPWFAMLFFVPYVKYVFMAAMCMLPGQQAADDEPRGFRPGPVETPTRLTAVALGVTLGLGMLGLSVYQLSSYGVVLFLGTPLAMGLLVSFVLNRRSVLSARETQAHVFATVALVGLISLFVAAEGAVCLVMAAPLAFALAAVGASLGRTVATFDHSPLMPALLALVVLPASAVIDADTAPTALREVRSSIVIDAPSSVVWRNVISFPPLPEPNDIVFRLGIAYPQRAHIVGAGVGAVRYCVFSTGAFVEPITRWEENRRLSFDVTRQPPPMQEWSPYGDIAPPHMDGYFRSRRGEFRLVPLPDGRTRLEGSTWYEMRLYPAMYWAIYGDQLISRIHSRVLDHIRVVSEEHRGLVGSTSPLAH